jgi:uncharacterized protein YjiK
MLNINGLEFARNPTGQSRLFVLCRDREAVFVVNPDSAKLVWQSALDLRAPNGDRIEWASPEGIAIDSKSDRLYIISDPDSTNGNWRVRQGRPSGLFQKYVPLLFDFRLPPEVWR